MTTLLTVAAWIRRLATTATGRDANLDQRLTAAVALASTAALAYTLGVIAREAMRGHLAAWPALVAVVLVPAIVLLAWLSQLPPDEANRVE